MKDEILSQGTCPMRQSSLWADDQLVAEASSEDDPARPPVVDPKDEPLPAHPFSELLGIRSHEQRQTLKEALRMSGEVEAVITLDGQVLYDPDRYHAALELGLTVQVTEFSGDDAIDYLCSRRLHEIDHDKGARATIVTSVYHWVGRGRPGKFTSNVDFPSDDRYAKTAADLASLAGVSVSLITKAKEIFAFGLAEVVISGQLKFGSAYRRVTQVRKAGLDQEVLSGALDFEAAWQRAQEMQTTASPSDRQRKPTEQDHAARVRELEAEVEGLRLQLAEREPQGQSGVLDSDDNVRQLVRERDEAVRRAEMAEARVGTVIRERDSQSTEIQKLKQRLAASGIPAPNADIPTLEVDGGPQGNETPLT